MRNHPLVDEFYQPDQVGLPKEGDNVHERNNRWALYSSLARGIDKVRLIALWDGKNEQSKDLDARLVKHMVDLMRDTGGMVEHINSEKLNAKTSNIEVPIRREPEAIVERTPVFTKQMKTTKRKAATKKKK